MIVHIRTPNLHEILCIVHSAKSQDTNSVSFPYADNLLPEITGTLPSTIASTKRDLGIILNNEVTELCNKSLKSLKKGIQENTIR